MVARKPKAEQPAPVTLYRSRATEPGPFGDLEQPFTGPLADVLERGRADRQMGMSPVIEYRKPGAPWQRYTTPVLVADLRKIGLAVEKTETSVNMITGKKSTSTAMKVLPAGFAAIAAAMSADPLDFDLKKHAVNQ